MSERQISPPPAVTAPASIIIQPRHSWSLGLRDLWSHRELTYYLVWRDIKLRYKQTFFGAGWALIQPIRLMGYLASSSADSLVCHWMGCRIRCCARRPRSMDALFSSAMAARPPAA